MSNYECGSCKIKYNNQENIPIMLSCSDTICKKCIKFKEEAYPSKKFPCPICCHDTESNNMVVKALIPKDVSSTVSTPKKEEGEFDVHIKLLTGDRITVRVTKEMTVEAFKTKAAQQANINKAQFYLSFKKPLINNTDKLSSYGINHTVTILQTTNERGGKKNSLIIY